MFSAYYCAFNRVSAQDTMAMGSTDNEEEEKERMRTCFMPPSHKTVGGSDTRNGIKERLKDWKGEGPSVHFLLYRQFSGFEMDH